MHDAVDLFVARTYIQPEDRAAVMNTLNIEPEQFSRLTLFHALADQFRSLLLFFGHLAWHGSLAPQ